MAYEKDPRLVECRLGESNIEFMVDTGSNANTLTCDDWQRVRKESLEHIRELKMTHDEKLKAYASDDPLKIICSFRIWTWAGKDMDKKEKFFVLRDSRSSNISLKLQNVDGSWHGENYWQPK